MSLNEFICKNAGICGRSPTLQELCDLFDLCLTGIHKTPPTPIQVLNTKLNMTEICNSGLTLNDVKTITNMFVSNSVPTIATTTIAPTTATTTTIAIVADIVQPMSPELITIIVISSLAGLGLLIGLGFILKKKLSK